MSGVRRAAFAHRFMGLFVLPAFVAPFLDAIQYLDEATHPVPIVVSLVTYSLAGLIVAVPRWDGRRFHALPAAVSAVLFLTAAQQGYAVTPRAMDAGQVPWFHLGFIAELLALGMRRRPGWAFLVWCGVTVLSVARWPVVDGVPLPIEAYHVVGVAVMIVTWLVERQYNFFMRRREDTRRILDAARSRDEAERGIRYASSQRVDVVRRLAGGLLEQIAHETAEVTDYDLQQFRLTEAQLRDSIRGRSIATPHILELTRAARARGIAVDILDERGYPPSPEVLASTAEQLAQVLAQAESGVVTVRALPPDDTAAVFIVHDSQNPDDDPVAVEIEDVTGTASVF
ncbi:hypothetical protein EAE32_02990 [Kocuria tytonicola]|uniref:Histidine kinase n=1 Tax=Kocuria tytonicola TaxID=2055946 RepID=A0A3L9L5D1_9MICC|nr:hypothetical protein [Kocuria tytonicola]RLY94196.1 hypothetical protein EAE32_02990 [Kocuria tytonicola]